MICAALPGINLGGIIRSRRSPLQGAASPAPAAASIRGASGALVPVAAAPMNMAAATVNNSAAMISLDGMEPRTADPDPLSSRRSTSRSISGSSFERISIEASSQHAADHSRARLAARQNNSASLPVSNLTPERPNIAHDLPACDLAGKDLCIRNRPTGRIIFQPCHPPPRKELTSP